MNTLTIPEFHAALKAQGVGAREHCAFKCPICKTVQSAANWIRATGRSFEEIEKSLGFSCIGRAINAGPHKNGSKPGKGCDWTLGGFFKLHKLEIVDEAGKHHPMFELATPEEAQAHERAQPVTAA